MLSVRSSARLECWRTPWTPDSAGAVVFAARLVLPAVDFALTALAVSRHKCLHSGQ
jgi:hypothetical protein